MIVKWSLLLPLIRYMSDSNSDFSSTSLRSVAKKQWHFRKILEYLGDWFQAISYYFQLANNRYLLQNSLSQQMSSTAFTFTYRHLGLGAQEAIKRYGAEFEDLPSERCIVRGIIARPNQVGRYLPTHPNPRRMTHPRYEGEEVLGICPNQTNEHGRIFYNTQKWEWDFLSYLLTSLTNFLDTW